MKFKVGEKVKVKKESMMYEVFSESFRDNPAEIVNIKVSDDDEIIYGVQFKKPIDFAKENDASVNSGKNKQTLLEGKPKGKLGYCLNLHPDILIKDEKEDNNEDNKQKYYIKAGDIVKVDRIPSEIRAMLGLKSKIGKTYKVVRAYGISYDKFNVELENGDDLFCEWVTKI